MIEAFESFEERLGEKFGFNFVIHFEDSIVLLAGICIGMIIMAFLSGRVVFKLTKVDSLGSTKLKLINLKSEGIRQYIAAPNSVGESIETLLIVIFRPLTQYNKYSYRDERRTKILIALLVVITIILIVLALLCTMTIIADGQ